MVIVIRGVQIKPYPEKRLEQAVKDLIEKNLDLGNIIRISTADVVKMAQSGGYILPGHVDRHKEMQLEGYCATVLFNFHPNHGIIKKEHEGKSMTYEFRPAGMAKDVEA